MAEVPDTRISNKAPQPAPDRVGQIFEPYVLVRRLGEGGMGEVYAGRHQRLGREVAIKVLREEYAKHPEVVQRFFHEAKVVNELKHPNTVEILDFVEEPDRVYLVMELLEGRNLSELDREQGPISLQRLCSLFAQACDALHAAHQHGVVHRDIKPDNLFVCGAPGTERLKVLDFGIARRLGGSSTRAGMVLGTPDYMAPEQATGREVDARADVYSLGLSLCQLLSHAPSTYETQLPPLSRAANGDPIPPELSKLLAAMVSLDPAARPSSLESVRDLLRTMAATGAPALKTTQEAMVAAGLEPRAPRATRWAFALGAIVLAVGATIAVRSLGPDEPTPVLQPPPVEAPTPPPAPPTTVAPLSPVEVPRPPKQDPAPRPVPVKRVKPAEPAVNVQPPQPTPLPAPPDPLIALRGRAEAVRRRFDRLVQQYGDKQLTSLEKAVVKQVIADAALGDAQLLDGSVTSAEHALLDAERRLGH